MEGININIENKYNSELKEITLLLKKIYYYSRSELGCEESVANARKISEALCKLILFDLKGIPNEIIGYDVPNDRGVNEEIVIDAFSYNFYLNKNINNNVSVSTNISEKRRRINSFVNSKLVLGGLLKELHRLK